MKEYYGNYLGVCVYNKDPEFRGRVKVFIPHIMPALYEKWNQAGTDINIKSLGANLNGALDDNVLKTLQKILPWCEAASPIIGSCTAGHRDSSTGNWLQSAKDVLGRAVAGATNLASGALAAGKSLLDSSSASSLGQKIIAATNYPKHYNPKTGTTGASTYCAAISTNALNKTFGVNIAPTASAKDFGPNLVKAGFQPVAYDPNATYPPGAVKVSNGGENGHMELSDGTGKWVWSEAGPGNAYNGNASNIQVYLPSQEMYQRAEPGAQIDPTAVTNNSTATDQAPTTANATTAAPDGSAQGLRPAAMPFKNPEGAPALQGQEGQDAKPDTKGVTPQFPNSSLEPCSGTTYGGPETDLTTLLDIKPSQRPPEILAKYSPEFIARQEASMNARGMRTGTLNLADAYNGCYGPLNADHTVGSTHYPGGTVLSIFNNDKSPFNPSGNNPAGTYTVTDTGNAERCYFHFDFFTNTPAAYEGKLSNLFCAVQSLGSKTNSQYRKAQAAYGGQPMSDKTVGDGGGGSKGTGGKAPSSNVIQTTTGKGPSPTDTNGMAQGMFAVPNEGAFLWVFFQEGNPLFPVYFAASFGPTEWASAYHGSSPPLYYPNANDSSDNKVYTQSSVFRPNGSGAILFNDSSGDSIGDQRGIKIANHNGAHLAFQNDHTVLYSPDDFYKQSDGHSFDAALGNREHYTQGDHNMVTMGDHFVKVGNITQKAFDAVKGIQDILNQANEIMKQN